MPLEGGVVFGWGSHGNEAWMAWFGSSVSKEYLSEFPL